MPPDAFSCGTCRYFQPTLIHKATGLAETGLCRRRAPAHNGFPAVSADGWCGDFTPGSEVAGEQAPEAAEVAADATSDADAKLLAIIDRDNDRGRIAMLENGLREMAELALCEIKERKAQLDEELIIGMGDDDLQARFLRKSLQLAGRESRINFLLQHCGLTLSTQETQP